MDLNAVMKKMDEIQYGWLDIHDNLHINTIDNIQKLYRVSSIEEILTNKVGICFDQVELERYILGEECNTTSYTIIHPNMSHAFLALEKDRKWIYFEHSSSKNKGIYYFDSKEDLLEFTPNSFAKSHHIKNTSRIMQLEYPPLAPNTTFEEIKSIVLKENVSKTIK